MNDEFTEFNLQEVKTIPHRDTNTLSDDKPNSDIVIFNQNASFNSKSSSLISNNQFSIEREEKINFLSRRLSQFASPKLKRLEKFSKNVSESLEKKKNIVVIGVGLIISMSIMAFTWDDNNFLSNLINIFPNIITIIYLFSSACKPKDNKDEIIKDLQENIEFLKKNAEDEKKSEDKINKLVSCIEEVEYLGNSDFRNFMNKFMSENGNLDDIKESLRKHKTLLKQFSDISSDNSEIYPDDDLKSVLGMVEKIRGNKELNGQGKISKRAKEDILAVLDDSKEIINTYLSEREVSKNFRFYSDALRKQSMGKAELKSFKSMKLRKDFSYYNKQRNTIEEENI